MRLVAALCLCFLGSVPAWAAADTLNVKEGLWETTTTVKMGGLQLPPELLQNLPEEQRAQLQRLDGRPRVDRACVTRRDIQEAFERFDKQSACTRDMITSTPQVLEANVTCTGLLAGTGIARVEAPSSNRVQGRAELHGLLANVSVAFEGRWLSNACRSLTN